MNVLKFTLILLVGVLFASPAYATIQVRAKAETTVAQKSDEDAKMLKQMVKEEKQNLREQKRVERQAAFSQFVSNLAGDSDEQLIAILLTLFLGGLGLHRVYLKSKPTIILWYFLTFGGIFGIIPLIDLIRIIMGQVDHYRGNNSLFRAFES